MGKNLKAKAAQRGTKKIALKAPIKATKVVSKTTPPVGLGGGGFRLAGNHNETLLIA